jgi:hypothetical protein
MPLLLKQRSNVFDPTTVPAPHNCRRRPGAVAAPAAVLIRVGTMSWVEDKTDQDLTNALTTWFGPPVMA